MSSSLPPLASPLVRWTLVDDVALVTIDNPPVNAAGRDVRAGLAEAIARAGENPRIAAVVIAAAGRTFVAGADIREFGEPPVEPFLPDVCAAIETSRKPVVVAVHGTALGGGCELALAAHARVAAPGTRFAQPEIDLGIVPGAGGTQRLPRLVGMIAAIEMIGGGRRLATEEAARLGLVDEIATDDLVAAAVAHARRLVGHSPRRTRDLTVPPFDRVAAEAAVVAVENKARRQISPGEAARVTLAAADLPFDEGVARERATFLRLVASDQAAALRHVFFAEREAARIERIAGVAPRPVARFGVVGAGTMGAGIAVAAVDAGFEVTVVEMNDEAVAKGRDRIAAIRDRAVASGRLSAAAASQKLAATRLATDLSALAGADLVVEAVFDDLAVKRDLFARLAAVVRPDCVLATNTSYLDPNAIGEGLAHPERLVGLHFFSPAEVMRLAEVVDTATTSAETLATVVAVARKLGKLPIVTGVCEGFAGNRIWAVFRRECEFMLEEGALPQEIDAALEAFGLPMGPFAVFDLSGLDIAWSLRKRKAATRSPDERYVAVADRLCEMGRFGRKTGAGWYAYPEGRRTADPLVARLCEEESASKGIARRAFTAQEIVDRLIAVMAVEGERILAEGIVARASDIDLVFVTGYGWPRWLGGPMYRAGRLDRP
ncbi:MAG: 3-hydroxyacyl-CoA dehydrogenase NAD-binding domain-containing protein [Siculibacillus sp.]|nr:3-hydroxyacyl-CoA dehydrogenase NAD-binding domain-containing protein [Siculibacillus sp.]